MPTTVRVSLVRQITSLLSKLLLPLLAAFYQLSLSPSVLASRELFSEPLLCHLALILQAADCEPDLVSVPLNFFDGA